jgi:4'-phosphopantetheinyl transferase
MNPRIRQWESPVSAVSWTGEARASEDDAGLTPERIDVYLVSPESVTDDAILSELAMVLDEGELTRWRKFVFAADRHNFLVSHALVRFALSRHASVPPAAWSFTSNRLGRPEIASALVADGLRFNLSHTAGLIAVAVGRERDIGIDVENVTRELPIEAAALILSPAEIHRVRSLPDQQRHERLFALWTLKEAYAKGRGFGLSLPLSEFSFDFDEPPTEIILASESDADPGRWLFELHRPSPVHCLALAYDAAKHGGAKVRMVPLIPQIDG